MKVRLAIVSLLLMASIALADSIATIRLQHRPAEEVIPIIRPMLGPDDAISGQGYDIFLRSSPDTLANVRKMIEVLDAPARILQVSVFQGTSRDLSSLGISANVRIESGNTGVEVGAEGDDDASGGTATYSTTDGTVSINTVRTQSGLRDNPIHQVRVAEGTEAYIETGEQIPYFVGAARVGGRVVAGGVEYRDAMTGFYVLPRIRGDNVMLEVSPFKQAQSVTGGGNIEAQSASTSIAGPVGEWLLIGGVTEQVERSEGAIGSTYETQSSHASGTWIRTDIVE